MAHHAYYLEGDALASIEAALTYAETKLGLPRTGNPDVITLSYGLFSVEHARALNELAHQAPIGSQKVIIVSAGRLFHEAQNALLKLFEESPANTTLILAVPSAGVLLPTLRSRLLPLPRGSAESEASETVRMILAAASSEREKLIAKLVERAKSDKEEEKQAARREAVQLVEALMRRTYPALATDPDGSARAFLEDLERFLPILHERSAPLKLIFEHLMLVWPEAVDYTTAKV